MKKVVRNRFGIPIVVGCISCRFKDFMTPKKRKCTLDDWRVHSLGVCEKWSMSPSFVNVGGNAGRIKKIDFLRYVQDVREQEAVLEESGKVFEPKTIAEIESDWGKIHGSIYVE